MNCRLYHCFGSHPNHAVDTEVAVAMLRASECRYLTLNTHGLDAIEQAGDLPVGYATATFDSVVEAWTGPPLTPVLNINHPTTAREAVDRALRAAELSGLTHVKLEVLTPDQTMTNVPEVVAAAEELAQEDSLEVWPLIVPDAEAGRRLEDCGCTLIRVMGSPIGSRRGLLPEWLPEIDRLLADLQTPAMLDGGIGLVAHAVDALDRGFDSVLVNTCLFDGDDPAGRLLEFRHAIDEVGPSARAATARA
jgi:thiazole synthase